MIYSILYHTGLLFRFKHDGSGLPRDPGAIFFIVALAVISSWIKLQTAGAQIAPGQDLLLIGIFSGLLLVVFSLLSPVLGVAMALVDMTSSWIIIVAGIFGEARTLMPVVDTVQLFVFLYFAFTRKR